MEKTYKPISGYIMLLAILMMGGLITVSIMTKNPPLLVIAALIMIILMSGFVIVSPNGSGVLTLFGAYKGTIRDNGFFWVNPFFKKQKISLRARNLDTPPI